MSCGRSVEPTRNACFARALEGGCAWGKGEANEAKTEEGNDDDDEIHVRDQNEKG